MSMILRKEAPKQAPGKEFRLAHSISCHAWNADFSQIALCPNDNTVLIYATNDSEDSSKWTKLHTLTEHDEVVSAIDWSPATNMIVTCGHDRNAYVWNLDEQTNQWQPTLVILRINRAANKVRWSADGSKFAVASSAKQVPVCHYQPEYNWWVSKMIKKHKSSVLDVAWHPNGKFLLTGGSDFKCRVFSAYIEEVDSLADAAQFADKYPKYDKFGQVMAELDVATTGSGAGAGWIESVAWSPDGMRGAFVSHDSAISFFSIHPDFPDTPLQVIKFNHLPFTTVEFLSDSAVVAAGYDANPEVYVLKCNEFEVVDTLDGKEPEKKEEKTQTSRFAAARSMFGAMSSRGSAKASKSESVKTRHQNGIVEIRLLNKPLEFEHNTARFTTAGIDGRILFWDLNKIAGIDVASLRI
ncbi:MAG: hypothetical protein MHM6MM_000848 [Cercozoa sp. M6MM]